MRADPRLAVIVLAWCLAWTSTACDAPPRSRPESREVGCRGLDLDDDDPFGNAVAMSPDEADRAFNPPLIRPQIDIASDQTISELWVDPGKRPEHVFIVYESDIVVALRPWHRGVREMAQALLADGHEGELIEIRGVPVYSDHPQRPCFGGNAVFNIGGANFAVINLGDLPYAEVRRVAESAIETGPAVIAEDRALEGA